jgi:hypothetical protein
LLLPNLINGQDNNFFTVQSKELEHSLKKDYKDRIKVIRKESKDFDFVKVGAIKDAFKDNVLTLDIKDLAGLRARVTSFDYITENKYQFIGELIGEYKGLIILISDDLGVYGHMEVGNRSFELNSIDGGDVSILSEGTKNDMFCGNKGKSKDNAQEDHTNLEQRNLPCPMPQTTVLVAYTAHALNAAGNVATIQNRVNSSIAYFNSANTNSAVTNLNANLVVSSIEQTAYVENPRGTTPSNQQFADAFVNIHNATLTRKIQTNSDIVFLVSDFNWPVEGAANAIPAVMDNEAISFSEADKMNNVFLMAHEIGHLFGGMHGDDTRPGEAHGHSYGSFLSKKLTIMMQGGANGTRVNRWSNPFIVDGGHATGVVGVSNVANVISQNATTIASIRTDPSILYSNMSGPNGVYTISTHSYTANYGCGSGHIFNWSYSTNGINYTSFYNPSNVYSKTFTPADNGTFYVRCTITANGQTTTSSKTTTVNVSSFLISNKSDPIQKNEDVIIFPNPSVDKISVFKKSVAMGDLTINILDMQGRVLQSNSYYISEEGIKFQTEVKIDKLPDGLFMIKLTQKDVINTTTFQIMK